MNSSQDKTIGRNVVKDYKDGYVVRYAVIL